MSCVTTKLYWKESWACRHQRDACLAVSPSLHTVCLALLRAGLASYAFLCLSPKSLWDLWWWEIPCPLRHGKGWEAKGALKPWELAAAALPSFLGVALEEPRGHYHLRHCLACHPGLWQFHGGEPEAHLFVGVQCQRRDKGLFQALPTSVARIVVHDYYVVQVREVISPCISAEGADLSHRSTWSHCRHAAVWSSLRSETAITESTLCTSIK